MTDEEFTWGEILTLCVLYLWIVAMGTSWIIIVGLAMKAKGAP